MPSFRVIASLVGCLFENILDLEFLKTICTLSREIQLCYMQTTKAQISLRTCSFISAFVSRKCIWKKKKTEIPSEFQTVWICQARSETELSANVISRQKMTVKGPLTWWKSFDPLRDGIKGADQPVHQRSLISTFVFRSFESIISRLAKETSLSLALFEIPKTGFVAPRPIIILGPCFTAAVFFWMF